MGASVETLEEYGVPLDFQADMFERRQAERRQREMLMAENAEMERQLNERKERLMAYDEMERQLKESGVVLSV